MRLDIEVNLEYNLPARADLLLQIEAASLPGQDLICAHIDTSDAEHFARIPGEDNVGERIWMSVEGAFVCHYTASLAIQRTPSAPETLNAIKPHDLPGDIVQYLMPSRYCPSDEFQNFVAAEFGSLSGGPLVEAFRDWISEKISYVPGVSNGQTTALDSFVQRQGVCRDFAHVMIALARAAAIPARFASVYAPNVVPQDFHAVAQVYLDGAWHIIDPTGMATERDIAIIGVAADASGVAFMTTYGPAEFRTQNVSVIANP